VHATASPLFSPFDQYGVFSSPSHHFLELNVLINLTISAGCMSKAKIGRLKHEDFGS